MRLPVNFLMDKLRPAEVHLDALEEYMETLEQSVIKNCGQSSLDEWKAREDEWKRKVVNIQEHHDLENVYEPPADVGADRSVELETSARTLMHSVQL